MNKLNICFYGAVRTLEKTIVTIREKIIAPLSKQYTITIFASVWEEDDTSLYKSLDAKIKKIKRPKRFSKLQHDAIANTTGNIGGQTTINLIHALYSLKQVTNFMLSKSNVGEEDIVIFIRPDSKFYSIISSEIIEKTFLKDSKQIITPKWDNYYYKTGTGLAGSSNDMGANDRFIICLGKQTAEIIGLRYDVIDEYIGKKKGLNNVPILHAEGFLERLIKKNNITNHKIPICLTLLRENGDELGHCISNSNKNRKTRKSKSFLN